MSIAINKSKCIGCGRCSAICPGSLIKLDENKKAYMKYPKDCWGCTSCIKECPVYAIKFYLGADIGGSGNLVHTEKNGDILSWIFERADGDIRRIDIDQRESNKY
ncbi:MAG: ferredoxin family protein [Acutalibacteraceae bacterium]|nr:ferredoxin family protein [Acutalibacteraceae bacterium]